ncbi:MAG: hypothetical protein KME54_13195 [Tolypothrix brevis GSE-NOS-MK-07-07A]|jgi:hypothetical protein|nr:hypothetical protein [Tolypothrix brevis GSE-NOS-MK-07-07A]
MAINYGLILCPVNYLQCKDVPPERLYDGCDVFIIVNQTDMILETAEAVTTFIS